LLDSVNEWGRYGGVWCKRVQFLVMGELKRIKTSSLKSLILASLPMEYTSSFVKAIVGATMRF